MIASEKVVWPGEGGCWFCFSDEGDLLFDTEFDTYLHKECLEEVLKEDPEHPEAKFMKYLLE